MDPVVKGDTEKHYGRENLGERLTIICPNRSHGKRGGGEFVLG